MKITLITKIYLFLQVYHLILGQNSYLSFPLNQESEWNMFRNISGIKNVLIDEMDTMNYLNKDDISIGNFNIGKNPSNYSFNDYKAYPSGMPENISPEKINSLKTSGKSSFMRFNKVQDPPKDSNMSSLFK